MDNHSVFGAELRAIRAVLGLSQTALATQLGSTQRHVSFLETGRSQPTRAFLGRICSELALSASQRGALFEASGFASPFARSELATKDVAETLAMMQAQVLDIWPYPALILDANWNILRVNTPTQKLFGVLGFGGSNAPENLVEMLLSPAMQNAVTNWQQACAVIYFRLRKAAAHNPDLANRLAQLRREGQFDTVPASITQPGATPVFVPFKLAMPDGSILGLTSVLGQIATAQDPIVEGFEVELMLPVDTASQRVLETVLRS